VIVNIPEFRLRAIDVDDPEPRLSMRVVVGSAVRRTKTPVVHGHMRWVVFRPYWEVPASIARKEILPRGPRIIAVVIRARSHPSTNSGPAPGTRSVSSSSSFRIRSTSTSTTRNRWVEVPETVPVYVLYPTVAVEDGRTFFFDDIYGYDTLLAFALEKRYAGSTADGRARTHGMADSGGGGPRMPGPVPGERAIATSPRPERRTVRFPGGARAVAQGRSPRGRPEGL